MADKSSPIQDAMETTKDIAAKSVPTGTKVGESVPVDDPIQDAIDTTKEIAAKSVPAGKPGEPYPETHPIKEALETTKEIAGKSVPVGTPTDEPQPETHPLKDAVAVTKEIAAKSVPAGESGEPIEKKPEGGLLKDIGDKIVNTAEKIVHSDLNQDGKIGGKDA